MTAPTQEQLTAIHDFAKKNGKNWKMALHAIWLKPDCPPLLRQVRNTLGPAWLAKFRSIKFEGGRCVF